MIADEDLPADERETLTLAQDLVETGNLHPLLRRLRDGETGPEQARDALQTLGELDLSLLVQLSLDTLIEQYVEDPGVAHQTRRESRGENGGSGA
jgi:hypothetical protein